MKNILIINLKRFGDIFSMGHMIASMKKKEPEANISLMVFDEFSAAAKILSGIDNIITIDRKRIETIKKNKIYSDGLALEELSNELEVASNISWDSVYNFSNDKISMLVTSFLTFNRPTRFYGIRYNSGFNIEFSNSWSVVFNDVMTGPIPTPMHFQDVYRRIYGDMPIASEGLSIISNPQHDKVAKENLDHIRNAQGDTKIIGIQFMASTADKSFDVPFLVSLVGELIDDNNTYPVLLTSPSVSEKNIVNEVNKHFSNTLITIETDFFAIPSVLKSLDAVITPDTSIKHLCNLMNIPTLEVALGESPVFKQGSFSNNSVILTNFFTGITCDKNDANLVKEIAKAISYSHALPEIDNTKFTAFIPILKNNEVEYQYVGGVKKAAYMIGQLIGESVLYQMLEGQFDSSKLARRLKEFKNKEIQVHLTNEKNGISLVTKDLLTTLRMLVKARESSNNFEAFTNSLERLLINCDNGYSSSIPVSFFRAKVENLNASSDIKSTLKQIERLLYNLKSDLQIVFSVIKEIETSYKSNVTKTRSNEVRI